MALLLFVFSALGLPRVSSAALLISPISTTITVTSNETFTLAFKMRFDESPAPGWFYVIFDWDNDETDPNAPYWNFTYEGFVAQFTDGTNFSGPIEVRIIKGVPTGYPPEYYKYTVEISEAYGEAKNGEFWVNVTMRAAGLMNGAYTPHAIGDQKITRILVDCVEDISGGSGFGTCTIRVTGQFTLTNLYTVNLRVNGTFLYGNNLTIKFYSYSDIYQGEASVYNATTTAYVFLSVNVSHPLDWPIENATLVLNDGAGNILQTLTTFLVRRSELTGRLGELDYLWTALGADRTAIFREMVAVDGQWPYAPP